MKKIIFLMIFGCLVISSNVFAKEELVPPINPDGNGRGLINTDVASLNAKVNELERKVNDLERDRHNDQDHIRQVERDVSDLKRHF